VQEVRCRGHGSDAVGAVAVRVGAVADASAPDWNVSVARVQDRGRRPLSGERGR
jgi:hypothetical protein